MDAPPDLDESFVVEPIRRIAVLRQLSEGSARRAELEADLDVSKATLHRIVKGFADAGIVQETDEGVSLTRAGQEAGATVEQYLDRMGLIAQLEPLLNGLPSDLEFDLEAFADAEVVTPLPGHPQRPVQRVVDFIEAASSLRATAAVVLPIHVEVLSREVLAGMATELIVSPAVIEALTTEYPERFGEALEAGTLDVLVHDDIDVGIALDSGRAILAVTADSGTQVVAAFDRAEAVEWVESVYADYRTAAEPYRPEQ